MEREEAERIAEKAAINTAVLMGSKIAGHVVKELAGELMHSSPISPHCERILKVPPKCWDFRGIRAWVMCKAWDIMEKEKRVRLPVGEAWAEARRVCVME